MIKRNKALLCALASLGVITSFNTINANAMVVDTKATKCVEQQFTVSDVIKLIKELPYTVNLENKDQVKKVISAYDSLNECDKNYINKNKIILSTLTNAKSALESLESDEAKAKELVEKIENLKKEVEVIYCINDKGNLEIVKINKEKLEYNKKEIQEIRKVYEKLDYYIKKDNLVNNFECFRLLECKLVELA